MQNKYNNKRFSKYYFTFAFYVYTDDDEEFIKSGKKQKDY